jgi:UDP-glucose 4-epimerase
MMAVLVTGGAGYIGSHMVLELLGSGEQVVVLDNLSTGFRWAVPQEATLVVGDVGDQALVSKILEEHGIDSILYFAAKIVVPESVTDPLAYYSNNTVKTRALIETAVEKGIKNFVFSSTATVYGNAEAPLLGEDRPLLPINPYGRSKLMTNGCCRMPTQPMAYAMPSSAISTWPVPTRRAARGSRPHRRPTSSRWQPRRPSVSAPISTCSAPITIPRTAPACAITSR